MKISIIIPTLNEAQNILQTIESIGPANEGMDARQPERLRRDRWDQVEVIVADGGSVDGTPEIVRPYATVIAAPHGRARQMNAGAQIASGEVLLFLHGDSRLAPGSLIRLRETVKDPCVAGGSFTLIFDLDNIWLHFYAFCSTIDSVIFRYGDQGIFVRPSIFRQMNGYADLPLMEDIDFMRRMPRYGKRVLIRRYPVLTSARRFVEHGIVRQETLNVLLVILWLLGLDPSTLAKWYAARKIGT